ncbi:MAG: histidine kinase [Bacteroidales bacterium]|nr:histidine kinase [Bacteroidales bacterium]
MEDQKIYYLFIKKSNWIWHLIYWLAAAFLMFFIFSNRNYDLQIRLILVSLLIVVSYFITLTINKYLIPKFLFSGKLFVFAYILFAVFIFTLWIISFSVFIILLYSAFNLPNIIIPQRDDIVILIAGNYLIVIMAAVIHFVKESYRRLIEKNNLEKQRQLAEIKLKEANLKLLQGQIHPHFLFNMLNNLYGLVKENVDSSREVIIKLSGLLDYMLYECDKREVLLKNEIEFINNYIELERVRHDDDFNVKVNFPSNIDDIKIAPLVLFPFVENAFKHGFHNPNESFINIELNIDFDKLKFEIENSISKMQADKYLNQEGKGIGLKNIKERLELIYKDKYNLEIINDENTFKVNLEVDLS